MFDFTRILCPVDFSEASDHAVEHAVAIAGWFAGRITALHVLTPWFGYEPPILFAERGGTEMLPVSREMVGRMLESAMAPALRAHVPFETRLDKGAAADRILACAHDMSANLIVIGTHGRSGFERLILGSVAEKVLRQANCPVLTVPPRAGATARLPFSRLLCAVDFSTPSRHALAAALTLAEEADAELVVLHAIDWRDDDEMFLAEPFTGPEVRRHVEQEATARLNALIPADARVWCRPSVKTAVGTPHRQIIDEATRLGADLIVIGVHGRNVVDTTLFGSTTNQVVRRASCPVLTIRSSK